MEAADICTEDKTLFATTFLTHHEVSWAVRVVCLIHMTMKSTLVESERGVYKPGRVAEADFKRRRRGA